MARRKSSWSKTWREIERAAKAAERESIKRQKETEKAYQAAIKAAEKQAKEQYTHNRQGYVEHQNQQIERLLKSLGSILEVGLQRTFDFEKITSNVLSIPIPLHPGQAPTEPEIRRYAVQKSTPTTLEKFTGLGKAKRIREHQALQKEKSKQYKYAIGGYQRKLAEYNKKLDAYNEAVETKEAAIALFREQLQSKLPAAVKAYFRLVIAESPYPTSFPKKGQLSYNAETGELILEFDLPTYDAIMPKVKGYKYIKTRDEVQELQLTKTNEREMKTLYEEVIAAMALRTIHEVFKSDAMDAVKSVVFNGMVDAVDKATGQHIRPCLVSVQSTQEEFAAINLAQVDKIACLKHLKAQTSPASKELVPIKPIADLPKEDSRFVDEIDILSELDSRTNLLEITPGDFEHLIFPRLELRQILHKLPEMVV